MIGIRKLHKQHSSTVLNVPIAVLNALNARNGDYVWFVKSPGKDEVIIRKMDCGEKENDNVQRSANKADRSG